VVLCALSAVICVYPFLGLGEVARSTLYDVIAALALGVGWLGVRRHRPAHPAGWVLVLAGYSSWVIGDVIFGIEQFSLGLDGYPAFSDVFYLAGYAGLIAGTLALVRSRGRHRDLTALLDASILSVGLAVPGAAFVMVPALTDSTLSGLAQVVTAAYPLGDILVLAMLARLLTTAGARTWAFGALAVSLAATLAADLWWDGLVVIDPSTAFSPWTDQAWLLSYVFIGFAAAHPSMHALSEPQPRGESLPSARRLGLLASGLLLPSLTLALAGLFRQKIAWPVIAVGGALLSLLVLARMAGLLERVRAQSVQLSALAGSDALTGAPNRRSWDFEFSRACAKARDELGLLTIAIIDLDHFKKYNDGHGHQLGDRLLREAVAAWTDELGPDALLARYGGEEFTVLLPGCDVQRARRRLEALRSVTPGGQTFSAGISQWMPGLDPAAVFSAADAALYQAKRSGRDRVVISDDIDGQHLPERLCDVTVVVQPILDLRNEQIFGHELLSRFPHDSNVTRVFAQAHEDGHGDLLEAHVIEVGVRQLGRPPDQALFVNVSAAALGSRRFWSLLPTRLDNIVVELVEDDHTTDWSLLHPQLRRLRERGARLAVDDLGAGAGDLARLLAIRPDIVKVDRNVVHGCATDATRARLIRIIGDVARAGGAILCAEGVEEPADLVTLREAGVELAQGFLLGRPAPGWSEAPATTELAAVPAQSAGPVHR
jgi:diguanylate cyclase (GGDEF)-like protein